MSNTGEVSAYHNTNKMASHFMIYNHLSTLSWEQKWWSSDYTRHLCWHSLLMTIRSETDICQRERNGLCKIVLQLLQSEQPWICLISKFSYSSLSRPPNVRCLPAENSKKEKYVCDLSTGKHHTYTAQELQDYIKKSFYFFIYCLI